MFRLLSQLFLVAFLVTVAGCGGGESTGHTEDKTPGGTPTPPLMDDAAMNQYAKEQAKKAGTPAMKP